MGLRLWKALRRPRYQKALSPVVPSANDVESPLTWAPRGFLAARYARFEVHFPSIALRRRLKAAFWSAAGLLRTSSNSSTPDDKQRDSGSSVTTD